MQCGEQPTRGEDAPCGRGYNGRDSTASGTAQRHWNAGTDVPLRGCEGVPWRGVAESAGSVGLELVRKCVALRASPFYVAGGPARHGVDPSIRDGDGETPGRFMRGSRELSRLHASPGSDAGLVTSGVQTGGHACISPPYVNMLLHAYKKDFTVSKIPSSFVRCGIWPLDPSRLLATPRPATDASTGYLVSVKHPEELLESKQSRAAREGVGR